MAEQNHTIFPLEFFIPETPRSLGASSRSRDRWKQTVKDAARAKITATDELGFIDARSLAVTIFYFPEGPMEGDIDNIVKPILDGMIGTVYFDDRSIERVVVQKFEPGVGRSLGVVTESLASALNTAPPCIYIRIDDDLSWRRID